MTPTTTPFKKIAEDEKSFTYEYYQPIYINKTQTNTFDQDSKIIISTLKPANQDSRIGKKEPEQKPPSE